MPTRAVSLIDLLAHELRTPLTVVTGSLRQLGGLADPVQQAALERALRSCERLERLAAEMREWTRLEGSPPDPGVVALAGVLTEAVTSASATSAGTVNLVVGAVPNVMVRTIPHLLPGALASLLAAVIRAADDGEAIAVESDVAGDAVTVVARRSGAPRVEGAETFGAEWLGGLGFSMPLARAVIAGGGGTVTSTQSADGRLQAVSVRLAVARPSPSR
jgi:signal transduction histidine kinase